MVNPEIIVMLTHHDITVPNARELFRASAELPVDYWGFKDVGLSVTEMEKLASDFRGAGKSPVLEVVRFDEEEMQEAAKLAIDCGIEYFTGARFSPAVMERVHEAGLKYFPFAGNVSGSPIELHGSPGEIRDDALRVTDLGADGVDLVPYRYRAGDPEGLARTVRDALPGERVIIAGSINSLERMRIMQELGPFGYTMGGALFDGTFVPGGSFVENLKYVTDAKAAIEGSGT